MTQGKHWDDAELANLRMEALEHLNRLRSGEATEKDAADFLAWRFSSEAHEQAFRSAVRLQKMVRIAAEAPAAGKALPTFQSAVVVPIGEASERRFDRRVVLGGALAASFAGAFAVGRSLDLIPAPADLTADYRTDAGQRRLVRLAGGVTVDMNTRTAIKVRQENGRPAIELISGEAAIASTGRGHPLLVAGSGVSMGWSGRFNVRRDDDVCVTCLAGRVDVAWKGKRLQLGPSDQLRYDDDGISDMKRVDTRALTAWEGGTLVFRDMPMRQVVSEVNRYRSGKVIILNNALAKRRLTGVYYISRLDDFFTQARLVLGVNVAKLPGNIVILT